MCQKISTSVDGGPSGGSRVRRQGARTPIGMIRILNNCPVVAELQFSGRAMLGDNIVENCEISLSLKIIGDQTMKLLMIIFCGSSLSG